MRALVFDGALRVVEDQPVPVPGSDEALLRVVLAGICNTDLEIMRGYAAFRGVLGHEFVGVVERASDERLVGRRVVGEINAACGECSYCVAGWPTHCAKRTVLGIHGRAGAFADYVSLPQRNLHVVPAALSDEEAVFVEPLAAAVQILQRVHIRPTDRVLVLGDGKLGVLVAQVLRLVGCDLLVMGRHEHKLALVASMGVETCMLGSGDHRRADVVIECTGSPSGLELARTLLHPRGTIVLKSTFYGATPLAPSPYVVDEVTIVGSRCGPFAPALRLLQQKLVRVTPFIDAVYPLADAVQAMTRAAMRGVMKVLLKP